MAPLAPPPGSATEVTQYCATFWKNFVGEGLAYLLFNFSNFYIFYNKVLCNDCITLGGHCTIESIFSIGSVNHICTGSHSSF